MVNEIREKERDIKIDPMTFSVLPSRFRAIQNEMLLALVRSSRSNAMAMARDVSTSIHDKKGLLIEIGNATPVQTMGTTLIIGGIIKDYFDEIQPGDCYLINSPYRGNCHIGDMCATSPVFIDGELIFWVANKAHQIDSGSAIPTNVSPLLCDMYNEGIHVPPVRIQRNYKEVKDIKAMLLANVRYAEMWYGDLLAQIGSTRVGEKRLKELCEEYGKELILQFLSEYYNYTEKMWMRDMEKIKDGVAYSEGSSDPDQFGDCGIVKCRLEKKGYEIIVDYTGSSGQFRSGYNATYGGTYTAVMGTIFTIIDPLIPHNDGVVRHVKLIVPEGTCLNALPPAGTSVGTTYMIGTQMNVLWKCFMELAPERSCAGWGVCGGHLAMTSGIDYRIDVFRKKPRPYGHMIFICMSASGANLGHDGRSLMIGPSTMGASICESVEVHEYMTPQILERVEILQDSAGAGKWRGGIGGRYIVKPLLHDMSIATFGNYHINRPYGVLGGEPGRANYSAILDEKTGEEKREVKSYEHFVVKEGEVFLATSNGGGGYGDPLERDPDLVRWDAREELISLKSAREDYGVVLNTDIEGYDVDYEATERLRKELKAKRRKRI